MQNILILLLRCKLLENKVNDDANENNAKRCIENKIKKKSTPADSNILDTEVVVPLLKYLGKF